MFPTAKFCRSRVDGCGSADVKAGFLLRTPMLYSVVRSNKTNRTRHVCACRPQGYKRYMT